HVYGTLGREPIYLAAAVPASPKPPLNGDKGVADLVVAIEGMSERSRLEVFAKHSNAIVAKAATTRLAALAAVTTPMPAPASPILSSIHDAIAALRPGSGQGARDKLKEGGECGFCPEMVVVPAGFFVMGSPAREEGRSSDEGPQRRVTFARPFAVGRHPVTRGQFRAYLTETKRATGACRISSGTVQDEGWEAPGFSQDDRHPVVCVNWEDAAYFAHWLSGRTGQTYRLLSEAEREYVTRAGTVSRYHFGSRITEKQANFQVDFHTKKGGTTPIGSFPANVWGLHDVHGNVSEWVQDVVHDNYDGAPTDGSAWITGVASSRVVRGGSWSKGSYSLRSAYRGRQDEDARYNDLGFRIARTLSASAQ
ncbi:MAG: formylglycine-generating enzyme family protein, partial [Hyphomicrobium sp.]